MSLIRNGCAVSARWHFLGVLLSALLGLALLDSGTVRAQDAKQIKLTEKHIQDFMASQEGMTKVYGNSNMDNLDPKLEAQAEAVVKKNGFASLAEYDDVSMNISIIMSGIDPQTKRFTEPPEQILQQIAMIKADKSVPEHAKKQDIARLEAALKDAQPIQFKENIALVTRYFDKLQSLMQEQGPAD